MTECTYSTALREMPEEERPRERLARLGAIALRDAELLAVLFRTGTREEGAVALAERLLSRFGNLRALSRASLEELMQVKGVGRVKAIEIQAAVELGIRLAREKDEERPRIHSADDVAGLLMARFKQCETEVFKALLLNTKNEVLKIVDVATGGLDATLAMPRDVFRQAVGQFRDRPAMANMDKVLSYGELDVLSREFGSYLQNTLRLARGSRVAVMMPNLLQYPVAVMLMPLVAKMVPS